MNNLFDVANYPDTEPDELVAGDRWTWTRVDVSETYAPTDYQLKYELAPLDGEGDVIFITAGSQTIDGLNTHVVEVEGSTTDEYGTGEYGWRAIIVRVSDSAEVSLDEGVVAVRPRGSADDGTVRGWTYQTLAAIRATIKGAASENQLMWKVGGRELQRRSHSELLELEREFKLRWDAEVNEIRRKTGRATQGRTLAKMRA